MKNPKSEYILQEPSQSDHILENQKWRVRKFQLLPVPLIGLGSQRSIHLQIVVENTNF